MTARHPTIASVLGFAACVAITSLAHADDAGQELERAEQALVNLDYEGANRLAAQLVASRGLTHEQLVRGYHVLALTDAVLDKAVEARDAFTRLLTFDPSYKGDPNLGPKVEGPFMEARGLMHAQPVEPGVAVSVVIRPNEPGTIRVTTRDPTHLAHGAIVGERWGGEGTFTTVPVAVGEGATVMVAPPPTGTTRLDWYVQVVDERDNVIFESGSALAPKSSTIDVTAPSPIAPPTSPAPSFLPTPQERSSIVSSPLFWLVGGAVVAGVASTVYFATRGSNAGPPTAATLLPSLQCNGIRCN